MSKTWHQYQKYIIKLLNQHFALGFRQDPEKTGHLLGFARKFQGLYLPHRQDTMPLNYLSVDHGTENETSAGKSILV